MDIFNYLHSKSICITIDNLLIGTILIVFLLSIFKILFYFFRKKIKIVNLNIEIGNIGNITLELNKEVSKIAHKTWVEIMTRKVGLTFEEDKDVIVEVYNSWYKLFEIIRELLKNVEPNKKDKNVEKLEDILIKTLNEGLRPHLTKWQAKFRRWYDIELKKEENNKVPPQEIQKRYEEYDNLVKDLKNTNEKMVQFAQELKKLI